MRRRGAMVVVGFVFGLGLGEVASSCKEPTAIRIEARTNAKQITSTTFTVRAPNEAEDGAPQADTRSIDASGFIGSLVAVPKDDDEASVLVKVVIGLDRPASECARGTGYKGCIVARRRLSYIPGTTLALPIFLDVACRDIACDDASTCSGGTCVSATISCSGGACESPGELADGGVTLADGPTRPDAFVPSDGAPDGTDGGPDYAGVFCATKPCARAFVCCIAGSKPGTCVGEDVSCPVAGGSPPIRVACDGPEDCRGGYRCCASAASADCKPACGSDERELCHDRLDCTTKSASCLPAIGFPTGYSECR